jgi:AcrR family transcriptional regulator
MSRNERSIPRKTDERTRRTRQRLGMALLELLHDKPMDDVITVQQVLDRASVGRSTFYLHFRDKNDLLLSQFEWFLETMSTTLSLRREKSRRVAPVAEMFEHIGNQRKFYRALADAGRLNDFYDLAQDYLARGIEQRLRECGAAATIPEGEMAARGAAFAGSLLSLLRWWMDRGSKEAPVELDRLFHQIVWDGIRQRSHGPSHGE